MPLNDVMRSSDDPGDGRELAQQAPLPRQFEAERALVGTAIAPDPVVCDRLDHVLHLGSTRMNTRFTRREIAANSDAAGMPSVPRLPPDDSE